MLCRAFCWVPAQHLARVEAVQLSRQDALGGVQGGAAGGGGSGDAPVIRKLFGMRVRKCLVADEGDEKTEVRGGERSMQRAVQCAM